MITFVIPTYNAQEYLINCLSSIRRQTQPSKIIIVDGGSTDSTLEIARAYKCTVLPNPRKLAEFGVQIGILATKTPLVVVFAADNELPYKNWIERVEIHFEDSQLCAVWGRLVGDERLINQYFGLIQNDPLTWFLKPPHVWGANGLVYRTKIIQKIWNTPFYLGDNDAFQSMIELGHNKIFYFDEPFVIHHHCKSIFHWVRKQWRNHTQHYLPHKSERNMRWTGKRFILKVGLWCIYVPLSFPHSVYLAIRDRNLAWLYHFPLSFLQMCVFTLGRVECVYL